MTRKENIIFIRSPKLPRTEKKLKCFEFCSYHFEQTTEKSLVDNRSDCATVLSTHVLFDIHIIDIPYDGGRSIVTVNSFNVIEKKPHTKQFMSLNKLTTSTASDILIQCIKYA